MRDRAIVRRSKRAIVRERHLFGVLPSFSIYIIAYFSQKIKFFSAHSHAGSTSRRCTERSEEGAPFSIRRSSRWRRMRSRDRANRFRSNCHSWALAHHLCALSIELRVKVVETVRAMHRSLCRAVLLSIRISSLILCIYYITLFRKSQILFPHSYAGSTSHQGVALTIVRRLSYWR